jgi:hypothetical protein
VTRAFRARVTSLGASVALIVVGFMPALPHAANAAVLPTISIGDVTVTEGTGGTVSAVFQVTKSARGKTSVRYATSAGTASAPADFISRTGTLQLNGNRLTRSISVTVVGDSIDEGNENFFLDLSNPKGATIGDARGEATITDNDAAPTVAAVTSVSVPEGNAGTNAFASVDVTLSQVSGRDVSVAYATLDGSATTADNDYVAKSGTVDFAPGQTLQTILVRVEGDDANELDETFYVELSAPVHADLGNASTVVTITNNDPFPLGAAILSVSGASVREGASGTTTLLTFTIVRSGETTTAVDVDFVTTNGSASDPQDYLSATGNIAFGANETTKTVDMTVVGDRSLEHKETFFLGLVNPSVGAAIDTGQATGHIVNDDTRTRLSITKGALRISAHGRLSPARPGRHMVVRLFRKKNGVWIRIRTSRPVLRGRTDLNGDGFTDSRYLTRFARPNPGACKVIATFPGGATVASSKAIKLFRC